MVLYTVLLRFYKVTGIGVLDEEYFIQVVLWVLLVGHAGFVFWCSVCGFFLRALSAEQSIPINYGKQRSKFLLSPWRTQPRRVQILVLKCSNRAPLTTSLPFPQDGTQSQV